MKLLLLTGSPHRQGTTAVLADSFQAGAENAGHQVTRFDTAALDIRPCLGCMHCRKHDGICVHRDAMAEIVPPLLEADAVALVTPVYYFGMTAQIKSVIDRFFAVNGELRARSKQACLLSACGDTEDWAMDGVRAQFTCLCRYLNWTERARLLAVGFSSAESIRATDWPEKACALGRSL